jgi:peroxiredoxin Q/BCP
MADLILMSPVTSTPGNQGSNKNGQGKSKLLNRTRDCDMVLLNMANDLQLKLKEGDIAPSFTAVSNGGGRVSLSDFKGKHLILYFYPRDNTPGCTKEAYAFRDHWKDFQKKGAVVLGVSTDKAKSHDKFAEKYKLPFTLLADEDKKIVKAYGVWGPRTLMGMQYTGTARVTFLIGPNGKIKKIWPKVKVTEHAEEVLAAL